MVFSLNQTLKVSPNSQIVNLSRKLVQFTWLFFNDVEEYEFPLNCTFFFEDVEKKVGLKSPKLHTPR